MIGGIDSEECGAGNKVECGDKNDRVGAKSPSAVFCLESVSATKFTQRRTNSACINM